MRIRPVPMLANERRFAAKPLDKFIVPSPTDDSRLESLMREVEAKRLALQLATLALANFIRELGGDGRVH